MWANLMGASNALAAMHTYAGLVPPTSMLILLRMALVSLDDDPNPWYGEGREALARWALGRGRHAALDEKDFAAVERAITPLREIGAITTDRPSANYSRGARSARYRLHLHRAVDNTVSASSEAELPPEKRGVTRSRNGEVTPRKTGELPPEKRGAKEPRGTKDLNPGGTLPPDPLRQDPPTSDLNEPDNSNLTDITQHREQHGNLRPHTRENKQTPPPGHTAEIIHFPSPDRINDALP